MVGLDPLILMLDDPRIVELLGRCRALAPGDINTLARRYAIDDQTERRAIIERGVRTAPHPREAERVAALAASAVRDAALRSGRHAELTRLGLIDAQLAASDAAYAILLDGHLGPEESARLLGPWEAAR